MRKIQAAIYRHHAFALLFGCALCMMGCLFLYLLNAIAMGPDAPAGPAGPGVIRSVLFGGCTLLFAVWYFYLEDNLDWFRAAAAAAASRRLDNENRLIQSRIKLLETQIEPHFVFNTLTSIVSLQDMDGDRASRMEQTFIDYLEASLSRTRPGMTRIAREKELLEHYLKIFKIRMDERLSYTIDIEPSVAALKFPPMLIQPIVENAIKHGLEPKVAGGSIRIAVRKIRERICWTVADTGLGFEKTAVPGTGLTNIRERLKHLYGSRAALTIHENHPCGVCVRLEVPYAAD